MHKFTPKNVIARVLEQMQILLKGVCLLYILSFFILASLTLPMLRHPVNAEVL